jgi:glutamate transport system substrate-binding protein
MRKRVFIIGALVICLAAFATYSTISSSGTEETGKIRIGVRFDQPGLGFKEGDNYSGFDIDVARYVAKKLGYPEEKIIFKESPSKQRETLIRNGDVDLVFATYSITKARQSIVTFAGPYLTIGQDILVKGDNTSIKTFEDLRNKRICTATGSTPAKTLQDAFGDEMNFMGQPSYGECITALASGVIDAVVTDDIILAGLAAAEGESDLRLVGSRFTEESYGVGMKKGDIKMCEKVDAALKDMVDDGSWQKALDKNTQGSGYKIEKGVNPPSFIKCE